MPLLKTPAITLKSRKWGEADRIVTFYTLRFGKLRGVARGARRMKSHFGSALEPFVLCDLNLFEKPNDTLHRVSQADIKETFPALRESLALMAGAARMTNLVNAITPDGDPAAGIFETLAQGLRALNQGNDPSLTTLLFQIKLLGLTGFRPQTDHCAACGRETQRMGEGRAGRFSALAGGLLCDGCIGRRPERYLLLSPGSLAFLQQALRMTPEILNRLKASGQVRSELETAIEGYVTVVAGKRLPPVNFLAAEPASPDYAGKPRPE